MNVDKELYLLHAGGVNALASFCLCEMDYELRMEREESHNRYFHTLLLWLAKWFGGGTLDYKLPGARTQSAGLIILALTSQGQVCDTEGQSAEITDTWKVPVWSSGQRVACVAFLG